MESLTINGPLIDHLSRYTELASESSGLYAASVLSAHNEVVRATTGVDPFWSHDPSLPKHLDERSKLIR